MDPKNDTSDRIKALEQKIETLLNVFKNVKGAGIRYDSQESLKSDVTSVIEQQPIVVQREGIRLPRGGWIKSPFDEIKFSGKTDETNPMRFLKKFNAIANYEDIEDKDLLHFFGRCLKDQAAIWFEIQDFNHINEAREKFIEHFWGENQQAKFREKLYMGKYKPSKMTRMSDYALDLARKAKFLEPPMGDAEIIRCLKRHFDKDIGREIKTATIKNIAELTSLLEEIQDDRETYAENRTKEKTSDKLKNSSKKTQNANFQDKKVKWNANKFAKYQKGEQKALPWYNNEKEDRTRKSPKPIVEFPSSESEDDRNNPVTKSRTVGKANKAGTKKTAKETNTAEKKGISAITKKGRNRSSDEEDEQPGKSATKNSIKNSQNKDTEIKHVSIMRTREILNDLNNEDCINTEEPKTNPVVSIKIGETEISTLIDTGAEISVMSKNTLNRLITAKEAFDRIPIRKCKLRGAFGEQELTIACKIQVLMKIGDNKIMHEFYVVDRLSYPMVIGNDILTKYKALIDYSKGQFNVQFEGNIQPEVKILSIKMSEIEGDIKLQEILQKHDEVFQEGIGCVKHYKHRIEMMDEKPFKRKPYPIPEVHRKKVKKLIDEWEEQGIIKKAATQYINPLVAVMKKSGDLRICLDAREINKKMKGDHAQPPTIEEIFNRIGNKKYFSTLDITQAFWQIPLHKDSRKYTGFMFDNQTYIFKRMPFGLKTAGASFTRAMNKALEDDKMDYVIVYLDDILIASNSLTEHLHHIDTVLRKLKDVGFKINKEKCEFLKKEIKFLGHTFDEVTANINEETKYAIECFQKPKNKKNVQSFLGLVNWDRRFVKNLSRLTKPLENLLKKDVKFLWTDHEQKAFNDVKQAFRDAPTLYLIKPNLNFGIDVDASKTGLGARLYQFEEGEKDKKYTIAYASRSLKNAEKNYTITEIECLALIFALKKWHVILMGRKVKVNTDHRAIQFVSSCANASERIARWVSFMLEFDLEINHIPGKENETADVLSRQFANNTNKASIENEFRICQILERESEDNSQKWIEMIKIAQQNDEELQYKIQNNNPDIKIRDELIRTGEKSNERIIIPNNIAWKLLDSIHKYLIHFGTDKTIAFAKKFFKIKNLDRLARDVVASCPTCIATKYYTRPTRGTQYYDLPDNKDKTISLDIFGPLPRTRDSNRYIIVTMDQFSKFIKCYPVTNQRIETVIDTIENKYLSTMTKPDTIVTDNGGQFLTDRWSGYAERAGFNVRRTSPYNPQSNPVERVMKELGRVIRAYFHDRHSQWDRIIQRFEDTANNTQHFSSGETPIDLYPQLTSNLQIDPRLQPEETEEMDEEQQLEKVRHHLAKKANDRKIQAEKHEVAKEYQVGDKVWIKLHRRSDASRRTTRKIHLVYEGPYQIRQIIRKNAYLIEHIDGTVIGTYNSRQIRPHREPMLKTHETHQENENPNEDTTPEEQEEGHTTDETDEEEEELNISVISVIPLARLMQNNEPEKANKDPEKSNSSNINPNHLQLESQSITKFTNSSKYTHQILAKQKIANINKLEGGNKNTHLPKTHTDNPQQAEKKNLELEPNIQSLEGGTYLPQSNHLKNSSIHQQLKIQGIPEKRRNINIPDIEGGIHIAKEKIIRKSSDKYLPRIRDHHSKIGKNTTRINLEEKNDNIKQLFNLQINTQNTCNSDKINEKITKKPELHNKRSEEPTSSLTSIEQYNSLTVKKQNQSENICKFRKISNLKTQNKSNSIESLENPYKLIRNNERLTTINNKPVKINIDTRKITEIQEAESTVTNNDNPSSGHTPQHLKTSGGDNAKNDDIRETRSNLSNSQYASSRTDTSQLDPEMEAQLRELNKRESELHAQVKELLKTREKTFQRMARKRERIRKLEETVELLSNAPIVESDSDGEEIISDLMHKIEKITSNAISYVDKFAVYDRTDNTKIVVTSTTTVRSNKGPEITSQKPIQIEQMIVGHQTHKKVTANWASKLVTFHMDGKDEGKEVVIFDNSNLKIQSENIPSTSFANQEDIPSTSFANRQEAQNDDENPDEDFSDTESEEDEITPTEDQNIQTTPIITQTQQISQQNILQKETNTQTQQQSQQDKTYHEPGSQTKVAAIKLKRIEKVPRELKELLQDTKNLPIKSKQKQRSKKELSYVEESSDSSDDIVMRYKSVKRRRHKSQNKKSKIETKPTDAADPSPVPGVSPRADIKEPERAEEGGMRPVAGRGPCEGAEQQQPEEDIQPETSKEM